MAIFSGNTWFLDPHYDINKSLSRANQEALREMANHIIRDTTQYVPMSDTPEKGTLRLSATIRKATRDGIEIYWLRPGLPEVSAEEAAGRLWEGKNAVTNKPVKKWTTEGTGERWTEQASEQYMDEWKEIFTYSWMKTFQNR